MGRSGSAVARSTCGRRWYRRTFRVADSDRAGRLLLHFGAVDYRAYVWVNGQLVIAHEGGHTPFCADINGIEALVQGVHQRFPGYRFRQVGQVDGHNGYLRFAWELGPVGEPAPIAGSDVARLSEDGRFAWVIGFLDRVPAGASGS